MISRTSIQTRLTTLRAIRSGSQKKKVLRPSAGMRGLPALRGIPTLRHLSKEGYTILAVNKETERRISGLTNWTPLSGYVERSFSTITDRIIRNYNYRGMSKWSRVVLTGIIDAGYAGLLDANVVRAVELANDRVQQEDLTPYERLMMSIHRNAIADILQERVTKASEFAEKRYPLLKAASMWDARPDDVREYIQLKEKKYAAEEEKAPEEAEAGKQAVAPEYTLPC